MVTFTLFIAFDFGCSALIELLHSIGGSGSLTVP